MRHFKRFLGLLIAMVMCAGVVSGLAVTALAADEDSGYTYDEENEILTITGGGSHRVSGITVTGRIIITTSEAVTLTLAGVTMENDSAAPIEITGSGNVTIKLSGENKITSTHSDYAAVQISKGNLIITSADGDGETTGSLTATGGKYAAGIGTGKIGSFLGSISINGGTVSAASEEGAGIGTGRSGSLLGSISINGGTVSGTSEEGAGIGAGRTSSLLGRVNITGGAVSATSSKSAGIGRGSSGFTEGSINISGGYITAKSGSGTPVDQDAANITGGYFADSDYSASTVYGCSVASGYEVRENLDASTNSEYPCVVCHVHESYDSNGFCTVCEGYEPAEINSDGVYEIRNAGQLFWFAALVNGDTLQEGITAAVADADGILTANIDLDNKNYTPIGISSSYPFTGTFDGKNYTIKNLSVSGCTNAGLFGYVEGSAVIQNITTTGAVSGTLYVGGIVGRIVSSDVTIKNCTNEATAIASATYVGGVAGHNNGGTVTGCTNNARVNSSKDDGYGGGIIGYNGGGSVSDCTNTATVSNSGASGFAGGIIARTANAAIVSDCHNTGTVGAAKYAGGVIGRNDSGTVTGCSNTGMVGTTDSTIYNYAGGVAAWNEDTISECFNSGAVVAGGDFGYVGGVAGITSKGTITDCYNTAIVGIADSGKYNHAGGVVGMNTNNTVANCYNIGQVSGGVNNGGVAGTNDSDGTIKNCYCLENTASAAIGSDSGTTSSTAIKTAGEFVNGIVTYLLNIGTTDGTQAWYQTLAEDVSPLLDSSRGTVYYVTPCDGSSAYYSNSLRGSHLGYDSNGFCAFCGGYKPAERNQEGVYEIGNAGQLFWFAALVNGDTEQVSITAADTGADAVLTDDIDLDGKEWTPIGTKSAPYTGVFDGGGFEISGLSITKEAEYIGLFGYVSAGTIENLTVSGEINVSGETIWAGGIVGTIRNGVLSDLTSNVNVTGKTTTKGTFGGVAATVEGTDKTAGSTMENCANYGAVTASGVLDCTGGLVGYMNSATINNCANYGEVDTTGATAKQNAGVNTGGIVGYINNKTAYITNCVNIGKVSNASSTDDMPCYTGAIVGIIRADLGGITNTYYLDSSAAQGCEVNENGAELGITAKTADEMAGGEVTYLLQNGDSASVWGQDLASDAYPTLYKTNVVKLTLIDGESNIERFVNEIADKGVVIAAAYDADGIMIDMATAELSKGTSSVSVEIDMATAARVKAFVWESVETMVPLAGQLAIRN